MIKIGATEVDTIKIGSTDVDKVMLGGVEIWPVGSSLLPLTGEAAAYLSSPNDYIKYERSHNALPEDRVYPEGQMAHAGAWIGGWTLPAQERVALSNAGCNVYLANAGTGFYDNTIAGIKEWAGLGVYYQYQIRDPFLSKNELKAAANDGGDNRYNSSGVPSSAEEARIRSEIRDEVNALVADTVVADSITAILHHYEEIWIPTNSQLRPVVAITFDELRKGPLADKRMSANDRSDTSFGPTRVNDFKGINSSEFCYQLYTYEDRTHMKYVSRRNKEISERSKMSLVDARTGYKFLNTVLIDSLYTHYNYSYRRVNTDFWNAGRVVDVIAPILNGATGVTDYFWNSHNGTNGSGGVDDRLVWQEAYIKALTLLRVTTDAMDAAFWGENRADLSVSITSGASDTVSSGSLTYNNSGIYVGFTQDSNQSFIKEYKGRQYVYFLNYDEANQTNAPGRSKTFSVIGFTGTAQTQLKATVYTYNTGSNSHQAVAHDPVGSSITGIVVPALSYALVVIEPATGYEGGDVADTNLPWSSVPSQIQTWADGVTSSTTLNQVDIADARWGNRSNGEAYAYESANYLMFYFPSATAQCNFNMVSGQVDWHDSTPDCGGPITVGASQSVSWNSSGEGAVIYDKLQGCP